MEFTEKIERAIRKSAELHDGQKRENTKTPYVIHPFSVAFMLSTYTDDEDIIVAALLHDVLEDTPYTKEDIVREFGSRAAQIVSEVPEDKSIFEWKARKEKYLKVLSTASKEALMVALADKLHNTESLINAYKKYGNEVFKHFNSTKEERLEYLKSTQNIFLTKLADHPLLSNFSKKLEELDLLLK